MGSTIQRGPSSLFVLVRQVTPEKVLQHLAKYGGTVLRSSLSPEQDERLRKTLSAPA